MGETMKDTINRLARGVFAYEPPVIEVSEVNIEESIGINSIYCGELRIKSVDGQSIKGIVSTTNHAVSMEKSTFVGVDNVVSYKVDTRGIAKGEKIEGRFHIISSGGESGVTYSFRVVDNSVDSSLGALKNLFHFTNLVQTEPEEAYKLFVSDKFEKFFLKDDYELKNRYELLLYGDKPRYLGAKADIKHCVEEFLISIRKKNRIQLSVSESHKEFKTVTESFTDSVMLHKNTWGFVRLKVSCDNPCVKPETDYVDQDKFAGSKFELRFFVDYEKLHAGRNYARICFQSSSQTLYTELLLITEESSHKDCGQALELQKNFAFLMESYLSFRVKKINLAQWTKQSLMAIEKIRAIDDEDNYYKLIHAQLLISVRKRDEAKWLLNNVREYIMDKLTDNAALYSYYLYVTSLLKQETSYANESLKVVKRLYEEGNDDWRILWVMFYLDEEYEKNSSLKIARIKEQFYKGCTSPVMYLEAALTFAKQPLLLRVFDDFEIQTILFACKYNVASERLFAHVCEIAENKKTYSKVYWRLMTKLYERNKSKTLLSAIYRMMIKNEPLQKNGFQWIKAAVDADLRITNLYENYLLYCDKTSMEPLPKMLLMYFTYNSSLEYNLKAYLYANIYYNRYEDTMTFENYRHQIERFVLDQVAKGHISVHLAKLYKEILEPSMINEDTSRMLANILFSYRLVCKNPEMSVVYVKHKETEEVQVKPIIGGEAYINLFTEGVGIVVGDRKGNRYIDPELYECRRVFDGDKYIPLAFQYLKDDLWISLYLCENSKKYGYSDYDMVCCYKNVIQDKRVSEYYKSEFINRIIDYYYSEYDGDDFDEEYISLDISRLDEQARIKVIETYIMNGKYDEAMKVIRERGALGVNPKKLLRMCRNLIESVDESLDKEVLSICEMVFKQRKYDEYVLRYLVKYYDCSTKDMTELWKAAKAFEIDTTDLEERLLCQMMFIRSYSSSFAKIFESYYNHGARERVVEAYIAYHSYNFFVKGMVVNTDVFRVIEHRLTEEADTIDICKLALLKYYADDIETIALTEAQTKLAQRILNEMTDKKLVFGFYKKLAVCIDVPHSIMDKTILEYRTNPEKRVLVHYVIEGGDGMNEYMVDNMDNTFEGIFTKSFVLFYGDSMQYYITEHEDGTEELTESGNITNQTIKEEMSQGRYDLLNDMLACIELQDAQTLKKMMNGYVMSEQLSKELFKPL